MSLISVVGSVVIVSSGTKRTRVVTISVLSRSTTRDKSGRGSTTGVISSQPPAWPPAWGGESVPFSAGTTAATLLRGHGEFVWITVFDSANGKSGMEQSRACLDFNYQESKIIRLG
jgi:hypothetical protein